MISHKFISLMMVQREKTIEHRKCHIWVHISDNYVIEQTYETLPCTTHFLIP